MIIIIIIKKIEIIKTYYYDYYNDYYDDYDEDEYS